MIKIHRILYGEYIMKFVTFIKACRLAITHIGSRITDWPKTYLGIVYFPDDENPDRIGFLLSNTYDMESGSSGASISYSIKAIENLDGDPTGIDALTDNIFNSEQLARAYVFHNEKINEYFRVLVLLDVVYNKLKLMNDNYNDIEITNIYFDFDKDICYFILDNKTVYTDGNLVLFGD